MYPHICEPELTKLKEEGNSKRTSIQRIKELFNQEIR